MHPVVHLELRTGNLARACSVYAQLFGWRAQPVRTGSGTYVTLGIGGALDGGVVEHEGGQACWLPYVEVASVECTTAHASALGATTLLEPREGPAGWRSIVTTVDGGSIALWQPKR